GPCVAKRKEAQSDANTDYVMTYEELGALFAALEINLSELHGITLLREADGYARGFATSCGVTSAILQDKAMADSTEKPNAKFINGLDKKSMKLLPLYANGKLPGNFLEVMACEGGCVGGPCSLRDVNLAALAVKKQVEETK
ncbi:MAG: Fe-hydrogenase large subunit family protein, partial [Lentisphaeria bacterium]|nr:Fe-hydrogenase large subunit family protein [Lentisphaeria bacterium]